MDKVYLFHNSLNLCVKRSSVHAMRRTSWYRQLAANIKYPTTQRLQWHRIYASGDWESPLECILEPLLSKHQIVRTTHQFELTNLMRQITKSGQKHRVAIFFDPFKNNRVIRGQKNHRGVINQDCVSLIQSVGMATNSELLFFSTAKITYCRLFKKNLLYQDCRLFDHECSKFHIEYA